MQVSDALSNEKNATTLRMDGNDYDVVVVERDSSDLTPKYIKNLKLTGTNAEGEEITVKLKNIAEVIETESLPSVNRIDQRTYLGVSATIADGYNVTLVTEDAEEAMKEWDVPEDVSYKFSGENEMIMDAMEDLLLMMALGILLVYLIMVAQFQSLLLPFIIMFTIPLAFTGGFMALLLSGKELSLSETLIMYNLNDRFSLGCTESLLRTIATYTLVCEAIGAVLMLPGFIFNNFGFFPSLWYSVFYSVGSFCNAGTHFSISRSRAYSSPHSTKFQAAPCQAPVSIQTVRMLKIQRPRLTRLPPMGM
jgi:hypothetical protein